MYAAQIPSFPHSHTTLIVLVTMQAEAGRKELDERTREAHRAVIRIREQLGEAAEPPCAQQASSPESAHAFQAQTSVRITLPLREANAKLRCPVPHAYSTQHSAACNAHCKHNTHHHVSLILQRNLTTMGTYEEAVAELEVWQAQRSARLADFAAVEVRPA